MSLSTKLQNFWIIPSGTFKPTFQPPPRKPAIQPKSFWGHGPRWPVFSRTLSGSTPRKCRRALTSPSWAAMPMISPRLRPTPRGGETEAKAAASEAKAAAEPSSSGGAKRGIFRKNVEKTSKNGENDGKIHEKVKKHMEKIWKTMIFGAKKLVCGAWQIVKEAIQIHWQFTGFWCHVCRAQCSIGNWDVEKMYQTWTKRSYDN